MFIHVNFAGLKFVITSVKNNFLIFLKFLDELSVHVLNSELCTITTVTAGMYSVCEHTFLKYIIHIHMYCISSNTCRAPGPLFPSVPFSIQTLSEAVLYTGSASIYARTHVRSPSSSFHRVLFCTVHSSNLESDIVALSLLQNGDQCSYENRT